MEWKKELKVGDKFMYKEPSHFAVVTALNSGTISFSWYFMQNGELAGTPVLALEHFYSIPFICPITPLLESLL
jgi:hypothetical protein